MGRGTRLASTSLSSPGTPSIGRQERLLALARCPVERNSMVYWYAESRSADRCNLPAARGGMVFWRCKIVVRGLWSVPRVTVGHRGICEISSHQRQGLMLPSPVGHNSVHSWTVSLKQRQ